MAPVSNPTACILVIGNEVLSGRTQDANIRFLAQRLGDMGIPVREVRIIPDVADTIIRTVVEVRAAFDHVFTTGGIGPSFGRACRRIIRPANSTPPASAWRPCRAAPC
jgi:molybdopterin biosynthesis enzyme MoaB